MPHYTLQSLFTPSEACASRQRMLTPARAGRRTPDARGRQRTRAGRIACRRCGGAATGQRVHDTQPMPGDSRSAFSLIFRMHVTLP